MELSKKIKSIRIAKGLTQEELANACNVTRSAIANWEAGRRNPDLDSIVALSKMLEISIEELTADERDFTIVKRDSNSVINKAKHLSFVVPIISTIIALLLILALLLNVLGTINKKSRVNELMISEFDIFALQIKCTDNKIQTYDFIETSNDKNNYLMYTLDNLLVSENNLCSYQFLKRNICVFNISLKSSSICMNVNDIDKLENENNLINFLETGQPYVTEIGIYKIDLIIENNSYYINASLKTN